MKSVRDKVRNSALVGLSAHYLVWQSVWNFIRKPLRDSTWTPIYRPKKRAVIDFGNDLIRNGKC